MGKLTSKMGDPGIWVVAILAAIVVQMAFARNWFGIQRITAA